MVTPQLTAFIRERLAAGAAREMISQSLLANGWTMQDITDAFTVVAPEASAIPTILAPSFFGREFILSSVFIVISIIYVLWQNLSGSHTATVTPTAAPTRNSAITTTPSQSYKAASDALLQTVTQITSSGATPPPSPASTASGLPTGSTTSAPTQTAKPAPKPVPQRPAGLFTDGSYTGSAANAYYGTVQVKAIVRNSVLADVQFLQYPSDRSTSRYINSQAMPLLTQEAIQAQSAQVSGVSGATFTSEAFVQSLASALTQAKI